MRDLDDSDRRILQMLAADARQPYSEIADAVGLSPPTVSNRIERMQEEGIIQRFTVQLDRSRLRAGTPVLVELSVESVHVDRVRRQLREAEAVEHIFTTAESDVVAFANVEAQRVREWLTETVNEAHIVDYDVRLTSGAEWTPTIDGAEFAHRCTECGNSVSSDGEIASIDGDIYYFCCPSCREQAERRHGQRDPHTAD